MSRVSSDKLGHFNNDFTLNLSYFVSACCYNDANNRRDETMNYLNDGSNKCVGLFNPVR